MLKAQIIITIKWFFVFQFKHVLVVFVGNKPKKYKIYCEVSKTFSLLFSPPVQDLIGFSIS